MVLEFNRESPSAMVVDWISNNIYFIDDTRKRIETYNIQSHARKVVIWEGLGDPKSITLHPAEGYAFVTPYVCQVKKNDCLKRNSMTVNQVWLFGMNNSKNIFVYSKFHSSF